MNLDFGLTKERKGEADPDVKLSSSEFKLTVSKSGAPVELLYGTLSLDPRHSRNYKRIVASNLVDLMPPPASASPSMSKPPANLPAPLTPAAFLQNGAADNPSGLTEPDYRLGLDALLPVDDVNLIAVPDLYDPDVPDEDRRALRGTGRPLRDPRYPAQPGAARPGSALAHRQSLSSERGFGALYYPWIWITDPLSQLGDRKLVPPSGHLAGVFARSDAEGVHHAPANKPIVAAFDVERPFDLGMVGALNTEGVNVIRMFRAVPAHWCGGHGLLTRKEELPWRYVNVRRLFSYVEESISEGIRWSVFAPNDLGLWKRLERTIGEFLNRVWRSGALFGATAKDAYYVRADEELNPRAVRALGQVIVEIGIAPVRPAEFVIVRSPCGTAVPEVSENLRGDSMAETGQRVDPYRNFNFLVEIGRHRPGSFTGMQRAWAPPPR